MSLLLAQTPALPLDEAGEYVAGAYIVFVVLLVIYVGLMAAKLSRISNDLEELTELAEGRQQAAGSEDPEKVAP
jgi:hypothetical protein